MKVALVLCPRWDPCYAVSSLALLSAALKQRGHEVQIFDLNHAAALMELVPNLSPSSFGLLKAGTVLGDPWTMPEIVHNDFFFSHQGWLDDIVGSIAAGNYGLIGFSLYHSNRYFTMAFARAIKQADPSLRIVFGGPDCLAFSQCTDYLLTCQSVDAVIFGEGDLSLPRLADGVAARGRLEPGPGVLLRGRPETWKAEQEVVENLDDLPYADYDGFISLRTYGGKILHTSRGCVRRCIFCREWREMNFRHMSGRRIFNEVKYQISRHPDMKRFVFGDSLINSSLPTLLEFCDLILAEGLRFEWEGYAIVRPDMTLAVLARMSQAGCRSLYYGVETGTDKLSREMGKNVPAAVNAKVMRDTVAAGIMTVATWMIGFPSETERDFNDSLLFLGANAGSIGHLGASLFSIFQMHEQYRRFNFTPNSHPDFWQTNDRANTFPIRLTRARRTLETAHEVGIPAACFNVPLSGWDAYEQRAMRLYEEHLARSGRAVGAI